MTLFATACAYEDGATTAGLPAISEATPASVGFSAQGIAAIAPAMQEIIDEGRTGGVMTLVTRDGKIVHWEATGAGGVAHARDHSPHLVVLDVRLPDGSGLDFCREMRQLGLRQPILMLCSDGSIWIL